MESQRCGSCKQEIPLSGFSPSYRGKAGTWCRGCFAAYKRGESRTTSHPPRRCEQCGDLYSPRQLKEDAAYCSRACKNQARNAADAAERLRIKGARKCLFCGTAIPSDRRADVKFCSQSCSAKQRKLDGRSAITRRKFNLKQSYGMTEADFEALIAAQGGKCAICGSSDPRQKNGRWCVDHCHDTGAVRGLLCGPCNTGIGQLADDPARLRAAADYLERNSHA